VHEQLRVLDDRRIAPRSPKDDGRLCHEIEHGGIPALILQGALAQQTGHTLGGRQRAELAAFAPLQKNPATERQGVDLAVERQPPTLPGPDEPDRLAETELSSRFRAKVDSARARKDDAVRHHQHVIANDRNAVCVEAGEEGALPGLPFPDDRPNAVAHDETACMEGLAAVPAAGEGRGRNKIGVEELSVVYRGGKGESRAERFSLHAEDPLSAKRKLHVDTREAQIATLDLQCRPVFIGAMHQPRSPREPGEREAVHAEPIGATHAGSLRGLAEATYRTFGLRRVHTKEWPESSVSGRCGWGNATLQRGYWRRSRRTMLSSRESLTTPAQLRCIECGRTWVFDRERWRLKVLDEEPRETVPYCPDCAHQEFDE